jgi:hypothetical protein
MRNLDDILQRAKQLKRSELFRLVDQLEEYLSSSNSGLTRSELPQNADSEKKVPTSKKDPSRVRKRSRKVYERVSRSRQPLYSGLLSLSGIARSSHSDVSGNKYKHLADIYATKPIR